MSGFDPERDYWGSDAPGRNYAAQLAKVRYADIGEREKGMILAGNAPAMMKLRK